MSDKAYLSLMNSIDEVDRGHTALHFALVNLLVMKGLLSKEDLNTLQEAIKAADDFLPKQQLRELK